MAGETLSCLKVHTVSLPSEDKQPRKENEELSLGLATTELCREFTGRELPGQGDQSGLGRSGGLLRRGRHLGAVEEMRGDLGSDGA